MCILLSFYNDAQSLAEHADESSIILLERELSSIYVRKGVGRTIRMLKAPLHKVSLNNADGRILMKILD